MKKRSHVARLGVLALALTLMTTCLMGATMAKYVTEVSGTGTAVVAKWAIKAGSTDGGSTINNFTLQDTTANSGVAAGKIAPGTTGSLPVYIDLTGTEVATKVTVTVSVADVTKLPSNFEMKDKDNKTIVFVNGTEYTVYQKELSAANAATFKENTNVAWTWPFNGTDAADTTLGTAAAAATFTVKVTAEQLDTDPAATPTV